MLHTFFYNQHLYKQRQAENNKEKKIKIKENLSKILKLTFDFCYLETIHIFNSRYQPKIIGSTLKINKQKQACFY